MMWSLLVMVTADFVVSTVNKCVLVVEYQWEPSLIIGLLTHLQLLMMCAGKEEEGERWAFSRYLPPW